LMPQISQITDLEQLKVIQRSVKTVNSLEELRGLIVSS
ncbi:MAG: transposase, partial [Cyanobacteria bacterium P01_D01_bin.116]